MYSTMGSMLIYRILMAIHRYITFVLNGSLLKIINNHWNSSLKREPTSTQSTTMERLPSFEQFTITRYEVYWYVIFLLKVQILTKQVHKAITFFIMPHDSLDGEFTPHTITHSLFHTTTHYHKHLSHYLTFFHTLHSLTHTHTLSHTITLYHTLSHTITLTHKFTSFSLFSILF
jgi:hypothetical protein